MHHHAANTVADQCCYSRLAVRRLRWTRVRVVAHHRWLLLSEKDSTI